MPEPGQGQSAQLVVDDYGPSTAVVLRLVSPTREVGAPITATSTDDGNTWHATVPPYPVGGLWWHKWTITGQGAGSKFFLVSVGGIVPPPLRRSYATSTDLANWLQEAPPEDADQLLAKATRILDRQVLLCAVYPVDADGMPTRADHIQAFADAACELVKQGLDTGDPDGTLAMISSASAGSISLGRVPLKPGQAPKVVVGDQVLAIIADVGLLNHRPYDSV